jgi:hypothetical protein
VSDIIYIGDTVYKQFTIFDTDGVTPLSGETYADFTIIYVIDDSTETFTLSGSNLVEIGSTGTYSLIITPTTTGNHYLRIKGDNDVYSAWKEFNFTVQAATTGVNIIEKILTNKMTIESQGGVYYQIVYADDGITELIKWQLYTLTSGNPTVGDSVPASRGTPET